MKRIIGNRITLVATAIVFILSCLWYYKSREIEPLIGVISSAAFLIVNIFFQEQKPIEITENAKQIEQDIKEEIINEKIIHQNAQKIYNIKKIDKADFS